MWRLMLKLCILHLNINTGQHRCHVWRPSQANSWVQAPTFECAEYHPSIRLHQGYWPAAFPFILAIEFMWWWVCASQPVYPRVNCWTPVHMFFNTVSAEYDPRGKEESCTSCMHHRGKGSTRLWDGQKDHQAGDYYRWTNQQRQWCWQSPESGT